MSSAHNLPSDVLDAYLMGLQALSGPAVDMRDPVVGLLFSLVAASAHIIVPAAVFNLKVPSISPSDIVSDCAWV